MKHENRMVNDNINDNIATNNAQKANLFVIAIMISRRLADIAVAD
jgi:hypothetical protein